MHLSAGGELNEFPVDAASPEIHVLPGQPIVGSVALQAENRNCGGALVPVELAWDWGDRESSWGQVTGHVPCGEQVLSAEIDLMAPSAAGTYHLVFGALAQLPGGWISSLSSWSCGTQTWSEGADLADASSEALARSADKGWTFLHGWECDHYTYWPTGLASVRVIVDTPTVGVEPALEAPGWGLVCASPYEISSPITFAVPVEAAVRVELFDIAGRRVRTLLADRVQPGTRAISWDGKREDGTLARSGLFFARIEADQTSVVRRMLLVR